MKIKEENKWNKRRDNKNCVTKYNYKKVVN